MDAGNIIIDDIRYAGTSGLYELIFKRILNDFFYTEDDMHKYKIPGNERAQTQAFTEYSATGNTSTHNHALDVDHTQETEEIWKGIISRKDA